VTNLATKNERQETKMMQGLNGNHMIMVAVACAIALALTMAMSRPGKTPIYGPNTDRSGHFTGSAGSSIDRGLNFGRGR
jgi:hypothetical protein